MKTLIKNGVIVTASDTFKADLVIENEKISKISDSISVNNFNNNEIIDASDKYILPGVIDPHTHFEMPSKGNIKSSDDFLSGTISGACGGVTTIIDFKSQQKGNMLKDDINEHMCLAKKSVIDYSFHLCINNPTSDILNEIEESVKRYGVSSFKLFMTYDLRISDYDIMRVLETVSRCGGIVQLHAENHDIIQYMNKIFEKESKLSPEYHAKSRPNLVEEEAIFRATRMTKLFNATLYIVHLSSKEGLSVVRNAQSDGIKVYAETCPQYLILNNGYNGYKDWDIARYSMSPPARSIDDNNALWKGINDGTIQTIATDHCPFLLYGMKDIFGKDDYKKIPGGLPGIETSLMLLHSEGVLKKRITINKLVEVMSTNVAKIFNIKNKGAIKVGNDADMVIFDPKQNFTINKDKLHMNVDYNPYENMKIVGMPFLVLLRGKKISIWNNNTKMLDFIGEYNFGKFIVR